MHSFTEFVNPYLGRLLENIKMDKVYTRGDGCYLYDSKGSQYLDCIASYGALPFGYNPKDIWGCIYDFHNSKEPSFIQPSALDAAGELAKRLIEIVPQGLRFVTFTNSGAETVEAAIKLCRASTGRIGILAAENGFHGKTLGALSATGKASYQKAFGAPVKGFNFVKYGDIEALETEFKKNPDFYAAFIVEPIQGEGGIVEPPSGYLPQAKSICSKYGARLVVDEIQTGLGRTGTLFACQQENICPDVLLLAKALGGGIMPIGTCICSEEVYNEEFALKHSSTFGANSLACRIGIKVIEMLTAKDGHILDNVESNGRMLKNVLISLQQRYPNIIKSIRGRGLMLGIDFCMERNTFPGSLLGIMAEQELLTPVISSYLLNQEKIRVAPTLNGSNVIRIEPPLIINKEQCLEALKGIENMLGVLSERNTAKFLSYLIGVNSNRQFRTAIQESIPIVTPAADDNEDGRFAFLVHPVDLKNYAEFDESLAAFNEEELSKLTSVWNDMAEPFVISQTRITSKNGQKAFGEFIAIPRTAEQMLSLPKAQIMGELKKALNIAKNRGAKIIGLGAYTSVVSGGGLYLKDEDIPLTTGNSYTVVSAVDAVVSALEKVRTSPEYCTAAVVGAAGSIGRGVSLLISERISKLILVGNPKNAAISTERLFNIAAEIYKHIASLKKENKIFKANSIGYRLLQVKGLPSADSGLDDFLKFAKKLDSIESPIIISTDIDNFLPQADIVISATNNIDRLIAPGNLKYGAVVCDMSRPSNVSEEVSTERPDVLVIDGGVIEVPGLPSLGWNFGFDRGLAYACMSETMMLALEKHYVHTSLGASGISLNTILMMRELAHKHGFRLGSFKSFNKPIDDEKWIKLKRNAPSSGAR